MEGGWITRKPRGGGAEHTAGRAMGESWCLEIFFLELKVAFMENVCYLLYQNVT